LRKGTYKQNEIAQNGSGTGTETETETEETEKNAYDIEGVHGESGAEPCSQRRDQLSVEAVLLTETPQFVLKNTR
jgi:hypothetical protein